MVQGQWATPLWEIYPRCDASETLPPTGVGGNITKPALVRDFYAGRIGMIGGMGQFNILTEGTASSILVEVHRLFEGFGRDGGYVMSASDTSSIHRWIT